ncbi:MAG: VWA domain-containing protein [Opitutales bacterium]
MTFAWPLLLLLLLLPLGLLAWDLRRRRQLAATLHPKILHAEAGRGKIELQDRPVPASGGARPWLCLGLAFAVVALARPQWGRLDEPVFDQSREILIAIDLSRSMLSPDVKPSRLERAKLLVNSLLEKLSGERVGLVVFSGTAFLQSPLSADYEILQEFLPALGPDYLPEGGTNYRALLETSLQAFGAATSADRYLIVLSDGEATDDNWQPLVDDLRQRDIKAICFGVGTAGGAMIPDGSGGFMKDERGAVVLSKLESGTLQELAQKTGGVYRDASSWIDLASVLHQTVEAGRKGGFVEKRTVRLVERFQWALAPALLCLLISFWREIPVRPRPRSLKIDTPAAPAAKAGVAAIVFLFLLGASGNHFLRAAETKPPELSPLGQIVSRLSAQDTQSGRDWAELARQTVTWGQKLQTNHHPVPAGPVRDALAATDLGSHLNPKTADWSELRQELEALLKQPDQPPPQKQPQDKNQKQSPKNQSQKNQSPSSKNQENQKNPDSQNSSAPQQQSHKSQPPPPPQSQNQSSAFGDMQKPASPPPQGEMQTVGGSPKDNQPPSQSTDPALAMPLQRLQQIKDQDSPAKLFQMMQGQPGTTAPKNGKNW